MREKNSEYALIKKVAWASWIGSALEYYDFFLYGTAAVLVFGPLYFPNTEPRLATLAAVASVGVGYLSRPVGAFFLGYLGDVYGRRPVLYITFLLMGISTCMIGALPTYKDIGIAAPVLLVCLRLLQGFAVSGEQAGAQVLLLELAAENRRGLYTSVALSGSVMGFIAASVVFLMLSAFLPESDLQAWGWRIPFLLSGILVAMGLWIRLRVPESPIFLSERALKDKRPEPLTILWRHHKLDILRVVLATQVSVVITITSVFSLTWAVNDLQIQKSIMLAVLIAGAIAGCITGPLWAYLSDRVGRRPIFMFGALASGALIWPYLGAISLVNVPLIVFFGLLLNGVAYSAANSVLPSLYGEMFSTEVRLSGVAIGAQLGLMLVAQAPTFAALVTQYSAAGWTPVALFVTMNCLIAALIVFCSRETSRTRTDDLGKK